MRLANSKPMLLLEDTWRTCLFSAFFDFILLRIWGKMHLEGPSEHLPVLNIISSKVASKYFDGMFLHGSERSLSCFLQHYHGALKRSKHLSPFQVFLIEMINSSRISRTVQLSWDSTDLAFIRAIGRIFNIYFWPEECEITCCQSVSWKSSNVVQIYGRIEAMQVVDDCSSVCGCCLLDVSCFITCHLSMQADKNLGIEVLLK